MAARVFRGFHRSDGTVGVRNYVVVVSTVLCSTHVASRVASECNAMPVLHGSGCMQVGKEREYTERILRGVLGHPNVAAALVVGLGCEQLPPSELATSAGGKPVRTLTIQEEGGTSSAIRRGIALVRELQGAIRDEARAERDIKELVLATVCGSSDTGSGLVSNPVLGRVSDLLIELGGTVLLGESGSLYGAAGELCRRACCEAVANRIVELTDRVERHYSRIGASLTAGNPTPGNIEGGLTTLVEKSLGGIQKGGTSEVQGVLEAGAKVRGTGLWIMDTSIGLDTHAITDMLVGGAQIAVLTTGRGNPVGSPLAPVIRITATRETSQRRLRENIDFDASGVVYGEETIEESGERLFELLVDVASGQRTKSEQLGHSEFGIGRLPL